MPTTEQTEHPATERARELREEGLTLIPLGSPGEPPPAWFVARCDDADDARSKWPKTPRVKWGGYQHNPPTDQQFEHWCRLFPTCNWAILTGRLVVIDADNAEAMAFMESGAVTRSPRKVITAKGAHYYYLENPAVPIRNRANPDSKIDFRGHGGYVVAPGSVHRAGVVYTEETLPGWGDTTLAELPTLTAEDIAAINAYSGAAVQPDGSTRFAGGGNLNFDATAVRQPATGEPVAEGGRNVAAASLAGQYIQAGDDLQTARRKLAEWNNGNPKPLDQGEIDTTLASVATTHARNTGEAVPLVAPPPGKPGAQVYTLSDLLLDPRPTPPFLVNDLFRRGDNVLLAGPPKSMKSFLMGDILLGVALGESPVGFTVPEPQPVAWLQGEMPWYETRARLGRHPWVQQHAQSGLINNLCVTDNNYLHTLSEAGIEQLIEDVPARLGGRVPALLAIDSFAALYSGDSEIDNTEVLGFLNRVCERVRAAWGEQVSIMFIHHTAKVGAQALAEDPFNAIRGAGAIRGWYDCGLLMFRDPKDETRSFRQLHFELRGAREPEPKALVLEAGRMVEAASADLTEQMADTVQGSFLALVKHVLELQKQTLSTSPNARNFAPKVAATLADSLPGHRNFGQQMYSAAMAQLLENGVLVVGSDDRKGITSQLKIAGGEG